MASYVVYGRRAAVAIHRGFACTREELPVELRRAAAEQHLANAVLRAVENRRPLIRCGNTGVTCAVDAYGRVDRWLRPFQQGFAARDVHVPTAGPLTFYTRHGDWLSHLSMLATAGVLVRALFAWWRGRGARRGSLADGAASR